MSHPFERLTSRLKSLPPSRPSTIALPGFRLRVPPEALPYPILRGLSRPLWAALRLAPGRSRGGYRAALGARAEVWGGVAAGGGAGGAPAGRRQKAVCFSYPLFFLSASPTPGVRSPVFFRLHPAQVVESCLGRLSHLGMRVFKQRE